MIIQIHKQSYRTYLGLISLLFFSFTRPINGQSKKDKPEIIQSAYYDAINLYFAIKNYSAYPVYLGSAKKSDLTGVSQSANRPNPGLGGTTPAPATPAPVTIDTVYKYYRLVESMTGKTVLDSFKCVNDSDLKALMDHQYKFAGNNDRQNFIDSVLARNTGMRGAAHTDIMNAYMTNTYIFQNDKTYSISDQLDPKQPLAYNQPPSAFNLEGGALPSLNATRLVEGLADFYIDRVNDELNDAFFIQLQNALKRQPELGIIFPQTLQSLNTIKITEYNASLNAIKSAYTNDMKEILGNLTMLATLKKYQALISQYPELTILFASCDMIDMINKQKVPAEILYQVSTADYIVKTSSNNYSSSIKLAALISNSLRNIRINDENKNEAGWIDQDKLNYLKNNKDVFTLFMGLFAQNANINFTEGSSTFSVKEQLIKNKDKVLAGQYIVYNFNATTKKIKDNTDYISGLRNGTNKAADYISGYLAIVNDLLDFSEQCLDVLPTSPETQKIRTELKKIQKDYLPMVKQANTILSDIEAKEYCTALYQSDTLFIRILSHLKTKNDNTIALNKIKTTNESDKSRKKAMVEESISLKKSNDSIQDLKDDFIKYGMFIATIATAKTSDDVKNAISAFALPKGSSRIKKENPFSVGLNSYVGISYALNSSYGTTKLPDAEWIVTAPMGLAINFLGDCKWNSSLTLYGGIIDIGAAFTYKINSDSTIKSDIELKQIFSPSIGLIYGFPVIKKYNIPLSIGISSQWGPTLHKVRESGNSVLPMMAQRTNFFIAVDIPILNFHVSRK